MMWCALVFMAFVAAAQAGPTCVHCDKAREGESKCNTQFLAEGNSLLHCGNNEVCTTDVRCDGKGRVLWIKGCESKNGITAMNTNICNDDNTRCRHHCDGDMCNQFAPADLVPTLACTPPADPVGGAETTEPATTTAPPTTTGPPPSGLCWICDTTEGGDAECNAENGVPVQCDEDEVCRSRYKCKKGGDPGRPVIKKDCKKPSKCEEDMGVPWVETKKDGGETQYVAWICCPGGGCNENVVPMLEALVATNCDIP